MLEAVAPKGLVTVLAVVEDTVLVAVLDALKPPAVTVVPVDKDDVACVLLCIVLTDAVGVGVFAKAEVPVGAALTEDLDKVDAVAEVFDANRLDPAVAPADTVLLAEVLNVEVLLEAEDELCATLPKVVRVPKEEAVGETTVFFSSFDVELGGENLFSLLSVNAIQQSLNNVILLIKRSEKISFYRY